MRELSFQVQSTRPFRSLSSLKTRQKNLIASGRSMHSGGANSRYREVIDSFGDRKPRQRFQILTRSCVPGLSSHQHRKHRKATPRSCTWRQAAGTQVLIAFGQQPQCLTEMSLQEMSVLIRTNTQTFFQQFDGLSVSTGTKSQHCMIPTFTP